MDLSSLYPAAEQFSNDTLTKIFLNTENPVGDFFNNVVFRFTDWMFILIATVISSIVAVKLDRTFKEKRINTKKLVKEAFSESIFALFYILIYIFFIFLFVGAVYTFVRFGVNFSSLATLLLLIDFAIIYSLYRKRKKYQLLSRLRKSKKKSK